MTRLAYGAAAALLLGLIGCGGMVDDGSGNNDDDAGPQGRNRDGSSNPDGNGFVDPQCPDKKPPLKYTECDVPTQKGCGAGEGCFPAVLPPQQKCEPETYATLCLRAGVAKQGEGCNGHTNCAAGYVCLITGGDTQCARLCDIKQKGQCQSGYVCQPIDVPGYAACL